MPFSSGAGTTRTIMINFAGSADGLISTTKSIASTMSQLMGTVADVGKSFVSALGGNFKPLLQTVVGGVMAFAKMLFTIPSFLLAIVDPINVVSIAMTGFSQAISASSPQELVAATRNMAPAMRQAVMAVRLLEPELKNLYGIVEQNFWSGFEGDINTLAQTYFPLFDKGLGGIATTLGHLVDQLLKFLTEPQVVAEIQKWMTAFDSLGTPILNLVENLLPTMLSLFTSFANILIDLVPLIEKVAGWFADLLNFIAPILSGISSVIGGVSSLGSATGSVTTGTGSATGGTGAAAAGSGASSSSGSASSSSSSGGGFFSNIISGIGNFFSGIFSHLAEGGLASAGQTYIVGENGPEMLHMGASGFVQPNSALTGGGGGDTHVHVKIGETELRGMITHEIRKSNQATALMSRMGRGLVT